MGRAPCCDKANVKKGPWSPEEDAKLKSYIEQHGTGGNWIALPQKIGLKRCGKSCRLRWLNYLRPNIKHGGFTEEEDRIICSLYVSIGSRWSIIAAQLPGRTDNDIKNYWNTRLKKKLFGRQRKENKACRSSSSSTLKQEMSKRTSGNPMLQDNNNNSTIVNNQTTTFLPEYFPLLTPMLYLNQEPNFLSHHASFSNLLSEMHGRYSDNENPIHERTNIISPFDQIMSSTRQQLYSQTSPNVASFHPINDTDNMGARAAQPYMFSHNYLDGADYSALQGESNLPTLENISYNVRNPPRFEELEKNLYEAEIVNDNKSGVTGESLSWGEISPLLSNPLTSNCGTSGQGMQQESNFNELRYLGVQ